MTADLATADRRCTRRARHTPGDTPHPAAPAPYSTMAGRRSRISPLTTITPIRPGWTSFQRMVLDVLPHTPWGTSVELERLAFIHSARWAIVRDLWVGGARHRPRYDYLLFESNFDGPIGAYLEAFADILGPRMRLVWNSSYGFPNHPVDEPLAVHRRLRRPIPTRAFLEYVTRADLGADHYFRAYDGSTRQILQGTCALAESARGNAGGAFAAACGPVVPARQPRGSAGDERGHHVALTTFCPVVPGREDPLRDLLTGLGTDSPFAGVPGLHTARWVLVDELPHQPGQLPDAWPRAHLLMTATLDSGARPTRDGRPDPTGHLQQHLGAAADEVHGHCEGYEGRHSLAAYLQRHRIVSQRFFSGYPYLDVAAVQEALEYRSQLLEPAGTPPLGHPQHRAGVTT